MHSLSTVFGIRSGPLALLIFTSANHFWTHLASIVKIGILRRLYVTVGTGTLAFPVYLKSSLIYCRVGIVEFTFGG